MSITWEHRAEDREFFDRELAGFVPDRVFDIHAHLYREAFWEGPAPEHVQVGPKDITLETYLEQMEWIVPGREIHGLHFPFPTADGLGDTAGANAWVSQEIQKDALARGQFLVRPTDDPEWVRQEVRRLGLRGLKPFASFARTMPPSLAELPEWLA